ncbi:MAG TPA: hypothetical protein VG435_09680 [Acidimicrobiales bacterium]|jgi:hypothetical protein|nr:hypothetical protein [Acidimicrobiales bacterium]
MLGRVKNMKLRYKIGAGVATAAAVVAGGGAAFAYFTTTGSNTGTASTGVAGTWDVENVATAGGALYPAQGSDTISAQVQNPTGHGNQGLKSLVVTVNAPSNTNSSGNFTNEAACTAADYALNAANGSGWVVSNAGDTATYTNNSAQDVAAGDYVLGAADGGTTAGQNALPTGLTLSMNDLAHAQDQCQSATINLTVAAN